MGSMGGIKRKPLLSLLGSCAALAIAAPAASADVNWENPTYAYSFGGQPVGTPAPAKTFTLRAECNIGQGAPPHACISPALGYHAFGAPVVTGDGYSLVQPNTCASGAMTAPNADLIGVTCVTTVSFTPSSEGPKYGALVLPNGPDVELSGGGDPPAKGKGKGKGKSCKKGKKGSAGAAKKKKCGKKKK